MTTTWNAVSLADPSGWTTSDGFVGQQYIVASGAMVSDSIATKRTIALQWQGITTAQKDAIYTKAVDLTSYALVLPDGVTYTVTPIRNSFQCTPYGPTPTWDCQCTVRET